MSIRRRAGRDPEPPSARSGLSLITTKRITAIPVLKTYRLALSALLVVCSPLSADVYKWKDAAGKTHISDQPPIDSNAERLRLPAYTEPPPSSQPAEQQPHVRVVMLSTAWCGVCRQARAWLTRNGVPFIEHDVEKSEIGRREFERLGGRGVPIILVGDQRMDGFSPTHLQAILARAK